ncbi:MAG: peptidyl-prolyl cis-trans isomerase [Dysgonamonadaceae bacterium]|jgi:hypothetical protein|nr:peptidyl-prolyl cis-trans isomerase [Dysgonamonadaceae bacterium]
MRLIIPLVVVSLLAISCNSKLDVNGNSAIVKVNGKVLYKSDLEENILSGLSQEDSIITAEYYIRTWINDVLLYDIALKNVYNEEHIARLVADYKKSLLVYQYQERLINEKLTKEINNEVLLDYYNHNKSKFKLDRPLVKGIYLKVPIGASNINEVRNWYKSTTQAAREKMEKYSIHNAASYDYFTDRWVDFEELMNNWPVSYQNEDAIVNHNKYIEQCDSSYCYFLNITDFLLRGDDAPFEFAKTSIEEMLVNQRKIEFLKKTEEDLYERALKRGEIKFYKE